MSRDRNFDGSYESSRYARRPLEKDIEDAMEGKITGETSTGGLFRQTDTRLDVWGKGEPGNYDHYYYNSETGEKGKRSGER